MVQPTLEVARRFCDGYTIVPIAMELFSDIKTPIEVLKACKEKSKQCYLLESVEGGEQWGRYSFLGFDPTMTVTAKGGTVSCTSQTKREVFTTHPNTVLREILSAYKSPKLDFLPYFTGGFVGYMGYDYSKYADERQPLNETDDATFDDFALMLFDQIIAFDHLKQKIVIIVNIKTDDIEKSYQGGVSKLEEIAHMIQSTTQTTTYTARLTSDFVQTFSKTSFCNMVEQIKQHIYEGDIFQAVIANRSVASFEGDLLSTYRVLRTINPSPYMFYLDFEQLQIAGASPETLVWLKNNKLRTFPIAGTCPRGVTEEEDRALIADLLQDEKERAEHNMLVDLGRNDLGKISTFGSVTVEDYQKVLKFSHVSHLSSTVTGTLKPGLDQLDAIAAVLPAGTLSGAPKKRAMEIIHDLEGIKRGVYGGAIGYIDFSGNMDLCIAIRMAVKQGDQVYVSAGAGIVKDSVPEQEYQECCNKAKAMIEALTRSQEVS